jgi:hypothetical protein
MRGIKLLFGTTALLAGLALTPAVESQLVVEVGVQPVCSYGYYGYAPYACAPYGYYGPGYFYNGIFLGMGPWGGWGYSHGWGGHRFAGEGGGNYHGGPGPASYRSGGQGRGNYSAPRSGGARPSADHPVVTRTSAPRQQQASPSHTAAPRATASRAPVSHAAPSGGGGGGHQGGGGGHQGGGGH